MYREPNSPPLSKWEELAHLLQANGLDEFHGRTGWVRCEPYQEITAIGYENIWIWIKTPQGTSCFNALPFEEVEDLWTRFLKEIQPLRELGFFQRDRFKDVRKVTEAPVSLSLPETQPLPETVAYVWQVLATTEGKHGRTLIDPVLHRRPPGAAYLERFRLHAEGLGMYGAKVGFNALLVK